MKRTYLISDYTEKMKVLAEKLQITSTNIISNETQFNDNDYHTWLTSIFKNNEIEKIIIPISMPTDASVINTNGLLIGMHIRLNFELPISKRIIPIVFLSNFTVQKIFEKNNFDEDSNSQNLLFSQGVYISSFDIDEILTSLNNCISCPEVDYQKKVLSKFNIHRKDGGHDIANAWGCYKISQLIGVSDQIMKVPAISSKIYQLYAKWLICKTEVYTAEKRIDLNQLKCKNKNILFIEDKADEGWGMIMKKIFINASDNFVVVDSSKFKADDQHKSFVDFKGFYDDCLSHVGKKWDLIIIDLRLNPEKEDVDNEKIEPDEFSGYKLIDAFLSNNEGYQIIVSTASNKIWNINAALKRGAYSYYIKESPEYTYTLNETKKHFENFKRDIEICFERAYLYEIFDKKKKMIEMLKKTSYDIAFIEAIISQLDLSFSLLKDANNKVKFAYAFVSLYLIIEFVNSYFVDRNEEGVWIINDLQKLNAWSFSETDKIYLPYTVKKDEKEGTEERIDIVTSGKPAEWQKFAGIYFQMFKMENNTFIRNLYYLITKRNGFIHNDLTIIDKIDASGRFLNHDIYDPEGYCKLFECVKEIVICLVRKN